MFISYAQNFEDVLLNRIFKNKKTGFYIDVGANHPINDSVTMAFYKRGWRGINIEPMKKEFEFLKKERPLDINLNVAVGEESIEGKKKLLFDLQGTGLSTLDKEIAYRVSQERKLCIDSYEVPVYSLASICRRWVKEPIDFLKIDVEGWEESVVRSNDWKNFRPTVLIIEATIPGHAEYHQTNIPIFLQEAEYQKVYFDGLNDFYLANESLEFKKYFYLPPNVFDDFQLFRYWDVKLHVEYLKEVIGLKDIEIEKLNSYCSEVHDKLDRLVVETEILRNNWLDEKGITHHLHNTLAKLDESYNQQIQLLNQKSQELISDLEESRTKNQQLNMEITELKTRIRAMESSKFWRLRKIWFHFKQTITR